MSKYYIGIDIGSTSAKTIVLDENKKIVERILLPTGWSSKETSEIILKKLNELNYNVGNSTIVATGYGRVSVSFANKAVTEITCHGKGADYLFGARVTRLYEEGVKHCESTSETSASDLLIIDIGGQDTKIIQVEN